MGGCIACMEEMRSRYKILAGTSEGKRLLGILRRRREDSTEMNF